MPQGLDDIPERVVMRVLRRVDRNDNGCWVSLYHAHKKTGYCSVGWSEKGVLGRDSAHRIVWRWFNGPVPDGYVVDHRCKNRRCVNLRHLRLLTRPENSRDGVNIHKTHCPYGHPYAGSNLLISKGGKRGRPGRVCRECKNSRRRKAFIR